MKYIADLHIHSPYSRATSRQSTLTGLFTWARIKGINLVGSGDFTHPAWFRDLKERLIPAEEGFFRLTQETTLVDMPCSPREIPVRFLLTAEISSIYKRHGQVRKVHNLIIVPDFDCAAKINATLAGIGNIESDGRPILGLDSRDLLEIVLENAPGGFLVPAHVWTPWFSLFGSKSGFDSVEECFGDLASHIFALETGLSSDPAMNRLVSALDRFTLISNSDCHSPAKLGREANLFDCDFAFPAMRRALEHPLEAGFSGTVEFFPEEGKYHWDGHRKCDVCRDPVETLQHGVTCPVCGKGMTIGVGHRVMQLADRSEPAYPGGSPGFTSLIPLPEVVGEIMGRGPATKGVLEAYFKLIDRFGSEFDLLMDTPEEDIRRVSPLLATAITRMRRQQVIRIPGYDGEFGQIHVFDKDEQTALRGQRSLFDPPAAGPGEKIPPPLSVPASPPPASKDCGTDSLKSAAANPEQQQAIDSLARHIVVTAGPGTGKTHTLTERLRFLIETGQAGPARCAVITFTNRAAEELRERLGKKLGSRATDIFIGTFHSFCLRWLREDLPELTVAGPPEVALLLRRLFPDLVAAEKKALLACIDQYFMSLATGAEAELTDAPLKEFLKELGHQQLIHLDQVVPTMVNAMTTDALFRRRVMTGTGHLFVDEFQDVNKSQYDLVTLLATQGATTFCIGDPDQAIYGFRGSDLQFFYDLAQRPCNGERPTEIRLQLNYRSAAPIITAAEAVIAHNPRQHISSLLPISSSSATIERYQAPTAEAEAEHIVRRIEENMGGISHYSLASGRGGAQENTLSFADFAVLCRTRSQFEPIRNAFMRRGIPVQLVGDTPFFMQSDLKPVSYLVLAAAGLASTAQQIALLSSLPGIGNRSRARLEELSLTDPLVITRALAADIPSAARQQILELHGRITRLKRDAATESVAHGLARILSLFDIDPAAEKNRRLLDLAGLFSRDLDAFALHLSKNSESTLYDPRAEAVGLMTIHAAKGLEFTAVFLPGLEEGLLPLHREHTECDLHEERRLFYVAITRARQFLFLSHTDSRLVNGGVKHFPVSRFLPEIPADLVTTTAISFARRKQKTATQLTLF